MTSALRTALLIRWQFAVPRLNCKQLCSHLERRLTLPLRASRHYYSLPIPLYPRHSSFNQGNHGDNVSGSLPRRSESIHHLGCSLSNKHIDAYSSLLRRPSKRYFHDYFITHLPSSSLHPDARSATSEPQHKPSKDQSTPSNSSKSRSGSVATTSRETTVVRIPLRNAKHHFGISCVRGSRPYNEDRYQAGTIDIPAFAKKAPLSVTGRGGGAGPEDGQKAASGEPGDTDPQVFYFGVFDGHGGDKCSEFLKEKLHQYVEDAATKFSLQSSLQSGNGRKASPSGSNERDRQKEERASQPRTKTDQADVPGERPPASTAPSTGDGSEQDSISNTPASTSDPEELSRNLISSWKETVGGYFKRFKPEFLSASSGGKGEPLYPSIIRDSRLQSSPSSADDPSKAATSPPIRTIATILSYAFLRADYDFITDIATEAHSPTSPPDSEDDDSSLGRHSHHSSAANPFIGGSTCTTLLISTPTISPFWTPTTPLTICTAHVGDTRAILSLTSTGAAVPLTSTHHPSTPSEATRLRRYAASFTTDSFGEERMTGLANTRAFGDRRSKRVGVSAEPEVRLLHLQPAEGAFLALVSDGVTDALSDQEIVDVVKEARTPEQAARDVTALAGELGSEDNATCMVVRLGGWERRLEGGGGSMGTKEAREWRSREAANPRTARM